MNVSENVKDELGDNKRSQICGAKCEIWSRVCGYYRPVSSWNRGKKEEFKERIKFDVIRSEKDARGSREI